SLASKFEPSGALRSVDVIGPPATRRDVVDPIVVQQAEDHLARLEQDQQIIRTLGSPRKYRRPARSVTATPGMSPTAPQFSMSPVPTTVGATASINFHFSSCSLA